MAGDDQNDPFEWDEDRMIQELCTPNRSWKPPASKRPLDTTALESKIRECGVDGQSLLTYSDKFDFPTLWGSLGVKKLPYQLFLKEAISQLRRASPGYWEWRRRQLAEAQQSDAGDDPRVKSKRLAWASPGLSTRGTLGTLVPSEHKQAPTVQSPVQGFVGDGHLQDATSQFAVPCQGVLSPALSPVAEPDHTNSETPPQAQFEHLVLPKPSGDSTPQEGPPPKKRRIAATILSAEPTRVHPSFIPTEADRFLMLTVDELENTGSFLAPAMEKSSHIEPLPHYLGPGILSRKEIVSPSTTTTEDLETEFSYSYFNLPPGRRAQVAAALKRFLRSNEPVVPPEPNAHDEDEESLLPVYGESDDEMSYDSETWREIQDEEEERRKMEAQKKGYLSKEMVRETVLKVITDLEARWRAEKQPKEDRKAWKEWQKVRRMPDRRAYIGGQKRYRDELEVRIKTLLKEFVDTQYTPRDRLENIATGHLELSVFARMRQNWLISMLESPRPPAKPEALPRPTPIRKKVGDKVEDGEELLSSSESEGMNEFIEYDDIGLADDRMDLDPASPPKEAEGINMEVEVATTETRLADAETNVVGLQTSLVDQEMVGANQGYDDDVSAPPTTEFVQERGADELPTVQPTPTKIKPERGPILTIPRRPIVPSGVQIIEIPDTPPPLLGLDENPGFNDLASLEKIAEIGKEHWQNIKDSERLLVVVLYEWSDAKKDRIYKAVMDGDCNTVWHLYLEAVVEAEDPESAAPVHSVELNLGQLFDVYISATTARLEKPTMKRLTWQRLKGYRSEKFPAFFEHLKKVIALLKTGQLPTPRKRIIIKKVPPKAPISWGPLVEEEEAPESQDPADVLVTISDEEEDPSDSNLTPAPTTKKKKKRPLVLNKEAKSIRITHVEQNKEFDRRRRRLQEELAVGILPADKSRLIVNETKDKDQALIFINDMIGSRIKDHQIEGVRFMWNQVVVGDRVVANSNVQNRQGQGCLLAHTMGLGKTMQVITLLVVIAEAAASDDPSVRSQIPEGLRESKTLVLCPSGLVDNWVDEFIIWAPEDLLGPLYKLSSSVATEVRPSMIKAWASNGGVLITGYTLFTRLIAEPELKDLLVKAPNIVVGDEAHKLKNPDSQQHQATQLFRTGSRIAMTGSPLTNNVMDYYAMINWVAPNYLADIKEFQQCFAKPIGEGLYADSDPPSKRRARRLLHALKEIVDPKVHRKDVQVLFSELPQKKEFIITLPLTELQRSLYEAYIQAIRDPRIADKITGQARIWSLIARLSLVLAHPQVFRTAATSPKNQAQRTAKAAKSVEAGEDGVDLPEDILSELLAVVSLQELGELGHSYKVLALLKILEECQEVGDKVLVFSHSIATLDFLEDLFKQRMVPFQRLDGTTPIEERQSLVKRFNHTDTSVYLISTKAGGVGLNIYGANRVVIFDFKYTPADEQQAIGRAYRLGQTKPVFVYWLVVGGTFEDDLHNHSVFKSQLASRVVDKKNPDPWSQRNLKTYFMMPRELEHTDLTNSFGHDTVLDALLNSADVGPQIRKITSNETFEKEETFELSAEDKLEAKKDIELMRLRSHNPQEYEREVERRRIAASMVAQSGYQQAVASAAPSQVNQALHGLPPTLPNVHSLNVPLPTAQSEGTTLNNSELLPIAAVGTHFAQGSNIPLPAAPHLPPQSISPNPVSQASQPRNSPATPNAMYKFSALMKFYAKLPPEKKSIAKQPHEVQNSFLDALERSKMDKAAIFDSMTRLHKLTTNERFAEAMLSGYIKPDSNKVFLFAELKKKREALKELSDAQFNSLVWEQKARSSQPRAHSSPNIKTEGQKTKKGPGRASKARPGSEDRRLGDSADFPLALD